MGEASAQWRFNGVAFEAYGYNLSIPDFGPGDVGAYDLIITDQCGQTISAACHLNLYPGDLAIPPDQPYDQTACVGGRAVIRANVAGTGIFTYQWHHNDGTPVVDDARISGSRSSTLVIDGITPADDGTMFYLAAFDPCGVEFDSRLATLNVVATCSPTDLNHDGHVDEQDVQEFQACAAVFGPGIRYNPAALPPGCGEMPNGAGIIPADLDGDGDVDQDDFAILQRCYSGANRPAHPNCAN